MKTNFYILIVLLLTFSLSNAQSDNNPNNTSVSVEVVKISEDKVEVMDTVELKEVIAKTSDIRKFLNRERNAENIKYVFPEINKRKTA